MKIFSQPLLHENNPLGIFLFFMIVSLLGSLLARIVDDMKKTSQGEEKKLYKMNIFSAVGPIFKLWEFFKISELGYRYYLELPGRKKQVPK